MILTEAILCEILYEADVVSVLGCDVSDSGNELDERSDEPIDYWEGDCFSSPNYEFSDLFAGEMRIDVTAYSDANNGTVIKFNINPSIFSYKDYCRYYDANGTLDDYINILEADYKRIVKEEIMPFVNGLKRKFVRGRRFDTFTVRKVQIDYNLHRFSYMASQDPDIRFDVDMFLELA